jgi:hypothetical protein
VNIGLVVGKGHDAEERGDGGQGAHLIDGCVSCACSAPSLAEYVGEADAKNDDRDTQ